MIREALSLGAVGSIKWRGGEPKLHSVQTDKLLLPEQLSQEDITCAQPGSMKGFRPETDQPHGFMFICNNQTEPECLNLKLFGLPGSSLQHMESLVQDGTICMLYNRDEKMVIGPFFAEGKPARNIVKKAWLRSAGRPFPAQVGILFR